MKKEKGVSLISILVILVLIVIIITIYVLHKMNTTPENIDTNTYTNINENINTNTYINTDENIKTNTNINTVTENTIDTSNQDFFVLYDGVEIEKKVGWINLFDNMINLNKDYEQKYNTKYYNYEKDGYIGESIGSYKYENGYTFVNEVKKVAISKKYDAIPRKYTKLNEVPEELIDMIDYSLLEIESVDLDNDGKLEYIVLCGVDYAEGQIGDGEPEASSTIMLFDSNFKKIADLVNLEDGFTSINKEEDSKVFLSLDDVIYIDIDEDNIMEIIIKVPTYEEEEISIVKYNKGKLEGNVNIEATVRT